MDKLCFTFVWIELRSRHFLAMSYHLNCLIMGYWNLVPIYYTNLFHPSTHFTRHLLQRGAAFLGHICQSPAQYFFYIFLIVWFWGSLECRCKISTVLIFLFVCLSSFFVWPFYFTIFLFMFAYIHFYASILTPGTSLLQFTFLASFIFHFCSCKVISFDTLVNLSYWKRMHLMFCWLFCSPMSQLQWLVGLASLVNFGIIVFAMLSVAQATTPWTHTL